jgi:hypothetical protein
MYKIIGADGQEYGPVTAEQIRQWIAEKRANAQTRARAESAVEWKPLGELPEFAHLFASPPSPAGPPALPSPTPVASPEAAERVELPAIVLMAFAVVRFILGGVRVLRHVFGNGLGSLLPPGPPEFEQFQRFLTGGVGLVMELIGMILSAVIFFAGYKMKRLESYALVIIGTVLSMLPCVSPCCCLGLPLGIWLLMVLTKPEVKAAFH